MKYSMLEQVVLVVDLPAHGLKFGDVGVVVERYGDKALEVEFVTHDGYTIGVLTLPCSSVRPLGPGDLPAVRVIETTDA